LFFTPKSLLYDFIAVNSKQSTTGALTSSRMSIDWAMDNVSDERYCYE